MSEYNDYIQGLADNRGKTVANNTYQTYVNSLADQNSTLVAGTGAGEGTENSSYDEFLNSLGPIDEQAPDDLQTPFEAGMDAAHGMYGSGVQTFWEALGRDKSEIQSIVDWTNEQQLEAGRTEVDHFGDKLAMAAGQIVGGAAPAAVGALLAPVMGASAATGALVTGTLAGALSGVGELTQKAQELDPSFQGDMETVVAGTAIGGAGGVFQLKRFTPMLKPLTELMEGVGETVIGGSAKRAAAGRIGAEVAKSGIVSGTTEAAQDASSSVAAHALTGTTIDQSKAVSIAKAAGEEFAIGAVFGGAGGTITGYNTNVAIAQKDFIDKKIAELESKEELAPLQGTEGNLDPDAIVVPVADATESPGTWNLGLSTLFGKSTDYIRKKFPDNKYAQTFVQQVHHDRNNPQVGLSTINEDAAVRKGLAEDVARPILNADSALIDEAGQRRVNGEVDLTNPIDVAMNELYGKYFPSQYLKVSREKADLDTLQYQDEKYLPIGQRFSWENARKDPLKYESGLVKHMTAAGKNKGEIKGAIGKFRSAIKEQDFYGNPLYDGAMLDEGMSTALAETADNVGALDTKKLGKQIKRLARGYANSSLKKSPLNVNRAIPEAPQSFWEEYADSGTSLKDAIVVDIQKKTEHLAYADRFGFNNEVAFELIGQAIVEGQEKGKPLSALDVNRMLDTLRLQQRVPTGVIKSPAVRRGMMALKSYTGAMILGTSALMSIPETIITGYKTNIKDWANGVYATVRGGDQKAALASMEDIGHGYNDALNMAAARIGEHSTEMGAAETWFIQKMTGLPHVQYWLSSTTLKATDRNMRRAVTDYMSGSEMEMKQAKLRLLQLGVDPAKAASWGKTNFDKDHKFYQEQWLPQLYRGLRTTIVEPHAVDKPAWMGDEHFILISQLKSFVMSFQNLVLNDSYHALNQMGPGRNRELVLKAAPYMSMYVLGQSAILTLKELMREGEVNEDEMDDKVIMALGSQGLLSLLSDMYHALAGGTGVLESASPAAGFVTRQVKGNSRMVKGILAGEIPPEQVMYDTVSNNAPRTIVDPLIRGLYEEAFGER